MRAPDIRPSPPSADQPGFPDAGQTQRTEASNGIGARSRRELLIDCEKDPTLRAVLVGMLLEGQRSGPY